MPFQGRRARRRPAHAAIALAAIGVAAGCSDPAPSAREESPLPPPPRPGGSFALMLEAPRSLDPILVDDVYEACIANQLYDGLLDLDLSLNPSPAIAKEWTISRDGREYRFVLRDDVRFHHGRLVTAQDFVYSFARIFDPGRDDWGIGGEYLQRIEGARDYHDGKSDAISGITAVDDTTLVVRLEAPYGSFLAALCLDQTKVVAREEIERWGEEYRHHPSGTGPFRYREETEDPPRIVLEANPECFRGRPYLDGIVFHVPKSYTAEEGVQKLLAGELQMCDLAGAPSETIADDARFHIVRRPEQSVSFLGFNVGKPPLDDVRVRRALAHAIDRERVLAVDPEGRSPAMGVLPPGMFGYSPEEKVPAYDPGRARELLAEAGYPEGEGLPVLRCWQADRGEAGRRADEVLREDLARVGIRLEYEYVEWEEFEPLIDEHRIPAFGLTWVADLPDPDSFLASLFLTDAAVNLFEFSHPAVDSLLLSGAGMPCANARAGVYRKAERLILDQAPIIPLFHVANRFAVRNEVKGLAVTPLGIGILRMERVWIDAPAS